MVDKQIQKKTSNISKNHNLTQVSIIRIDKSKPVAVRMEEYLNKVKNPCHLLCGDTPVELMFAPPEAPAMSTLVARYFISQKGDN